jgi:ABC-type polysaccharide/polyol phosphate transport system ATPase subunit
MTAASSIAADAVGVRFLFDRNRRVVSPTIARIRRQGLVTWGLNGVTFTIGPGEAVALIGPSGAGKTTLLRTLAGVFAPDAGRLVVNGRVGSLLAIDAGVMGSLTGRENATLLGVLSGMSRRESKAALERVKERSGLGDAFERPVGSYSQGMRARLGFAVADETEPEILLLDEVHEALDHEYRDIVARRAREILDRGGIVVAAGHDHPLLEQLCTRALLMRDGAVAWDGPFLDVQRHYLSGLVDAG